MLFTPYWCAFWQVAATPSRLLHVLMGTDLKGTIHILWGEKYTAPATTVPGCPVSGPSGKSDEGIMLEMPQYKTIQKGISSQFPKGIHKLHPEILNNMAYSIQVTLPIE